MSSEASHAFRCDLELWAWGGETSLQRTVPEDSQDYSKSPFQGWVLREKSEVRAGRKPCHEHSGQEARGGVTCEPPQAGLSEPARGELLQTAVSRLQRKARDTHRHNVLHMAEKHSEILTKVPVLKRIPTFICVLRPSLPSHGCRPSGIYCLRELMPLCSDKG